MLFQKDSKAVLDCFDKPSIFVFLRAVLFLNLKSDFVNIKPATLLLQVLVYAFYVLQWYK